MRPKLALDHAAEHAVGRMHDAHEIDVEHAPEQRRVGPAEWRALGAARVGDQDVDRAALRDGTLHALGKRARIGDIGYEIGGRIRVRHGVPQRPLLTTRHGDNGARSRQRSRHGAADAASAACHQRVSSLDPGHTAAQPCDQMRPKALSLNIIEFKHSGGASHRTSRGTIIFGSTMLPVVDDRPCRRARWCSRASARRSGRAWCACRRPACSGRWRTGNCRGRLRAAARLRSGASPFSAMPYQRACGFMPQPRCETA